MVSPRERWRRAFGLIEILVVVAILAVLAAFVLPRYFGGTASSTDRKTSPTGAARDSVCRMQLKQVRQAIELHMAGAEASPPTDVDQLPGLTSADTRCPVGGEKYGLVNAGSDVRCLHHGHEGY